MKNKNYFKFGPGNKKNRIIPLVFLLPFLFLLTSCKQEIALSNHLELRAEIGYDKTVSMSKGNPVKFTITNAGEDFNGEIRILMPLDFDSDTAYVIPIEIAANSQKIVEEYLPLYLVNKEFKYEILSGGTKIREGQLRATNFLDPALTRVAVISESPDKYNFFKHCALISSHYNSGDVIQYGSGSTKAIAVPVPAENPNLHPQSLSYENFTVHQKNMAKFSNRDALDFFDVIFIGDLSELALSEQGLQNLLAWVENGGVLIVETGENYEKMQRLLPEELRLIDFDSVVEEEIKMDAFQGTLKLAKGTNKRENVSELGINGSKLLYLRDVGAGRIMTLNTLIGEGPLLEQNLQANYLSALMEASPAFFGAYQREDNMGPNYYSLNTIPVSGEIPFGSIGFLLALYSLGIVPISYKILKHKNKQNLMWIVGPASSFIIILIISQIGSHTWGNKPISNEMSVIEYRQSQDYLSVKSEIGLFNNRKSDMKISWDKDQNVEIFPTTFNNYYDIQENRRSDHPTISSARYLQNPPLYYSYDTGLWDFVSARAEKIVKIKDEGTSIRLKSGEGGESIRIKNGLPMDLDPAVLYWRDRYYLLGSLPSGSEQEFQMNSLIAKTDFYQIRSEMGRENFDFDHADEYIHSNYSNNFDRPILLAFNKEAVGYNIKINDQATKTFARNLIVCQLEMQIEDGSTLLLKRGEERRSSGVYTDRENIGMESRQRTLESFEEPGYSMLQIPNGGDRKSENMNSLVTEFKLPGNLEIESIRIDFNTNCEETVNSLIDIKSSHRIAAEHLEDRYFIFNYAENKYDELYLKDFSLEGYVDSEGLVKNLEASEGAMMNVDWDMFLKGKFYEVKDPNYIGGTGLIRIKVLKPEIFEYDWFELRQNEIEIKGVYHDQSR